MVLNRIEAILEKVSGFMEFRVGRLPRSQKYAGLPAVAYGVFKRADEIVEEMIRQVELIGKERDDALEFMEQRNFEIGIEVSELEARIDRAEGVAKNADPSVLPQRPSEPPCAFYTKTGNYKFGASYKFHHPKDIVIPSSGQVNETGNEEAFKNGSVMPVQPIATPASLHNSKGLPIRPIMHMNN